MKKYFLSILLFIVGLAFFLRTFDSNWDQGYHMHPDERAIILYTLPLHLPSSFHEFLSPQSPLNPHFFAYGSLPLYFLKIMGIVFDMFSATIHYSDYDHLNLLGRFFSALADMGTLFFIFLFGKKLFGIKVGLMGSFFYAVGVLPIQLSHFYAVDTLLTFFIFLTLYQLLLFYQTPTPKRATLIGICFGLSLATKTSALALISSIGIALCIDFLIIFLQSPHKPKQWLPHIPHIIKSLATDGVIIGVTTICTFYFCEPYALIDYQSFLSQTLQQSLMTKDAFTFPYTLQYVGKIPYFYELKNIFLWGLGPILATISFVGTLFTTIFVFKKKKHTKWAKECILLVFFFSYFYVVGRFAIGFMRYMLPLYPLFCLFAAFFIKRLLDYIIKKYQQPHMMLAFYVLLIGAVLVWPVSFLHIYSVHNTRVLASEWITSNIPQGKTIAIEHWDDGLPIFGQQNYHMVTLPLYDPDTNEKWTTINTTLTTTDYIVIASNRLYVPLQKLTDCTKLPIYHCYPLTAQYYKNLFSGKLPFKKVAEFAIAPTIPFINTALDDQSADESFTVYDHPTVMIFKKNK